MTLWKFFLLFCFAVAVQTITLADIIINGEFDRFGKTYQVVEVHDEKEA